MKIINKRGNTLLIFGYIIGILVFSIGISYVDGLKHKIIEDSILEKNYKILNVVYSDSDGLSRLTKNIKNQYGINICQNIFEKNYKIELMGTYGVSTSLFSPKIEGRFLSEDEQNGSNNIAVIGEALNDLCYIKDNSKYIKISNYELKVVGTIKDSVKNNRRVYIPLELFIEKNKDLSTLHFNFTFLKKNIDKNEVISKVKDIIRSEGAVYDIDNDSNYTNKELFGYSIVILLISTINVANFSVFWINDRRKEIALRKTVGGTNTRIGGLLLSEMLILAFISLVVAFFIQGIISIFINKGSYFDFPFVLTVDNFIYSSLLAIVTAVVATIPSYLIALKIQPSMILKGE